MTVGDHFAVLIRGAVAADFRKGEKTREEITDLMAGGEAMADLGGRNRKLHGDPRGASAAAVSTNLSEGRVYPPDADRRRSRPPRIGAGH